MTKRKVYPKHKVFYECGCCGGWHNQNLPGDVDCRNDRHRFHPDELDAHYGPLAWEEITLDEQMRTLEEFDDGNCALDYALPGPGEPA